LRAALHHLYRPLGRHALGFASRVVCVSHAEAALVERHFPNTVGRLEVIPNGVDAAAIRAARPIPGEPPTVLAIGRLASYKRLDVVIEGFERWAATGSRSTGSPSTLRDSAQLVIVGAGPEQARLEAVAARSGLGARVRLLAGLSDETLHRWLRTASVLCSMSEHEAYGLAPAEALVADTPVVLSPIPAHRELADVAGQGAVTLVEPDPAALARALESRLASRSDPRRPLGGGPLAGGILGWDDVAAKLCGLYQASIWAELAGLSR
jgi:glycosyltransferase involved in cell wall biosynthesis